MKERNRIVWLIAEVWKLRGIRRNMGTERSPSPAGENDVKNMLLSCRETKWGMELIIRTAGLKDKKIIIEQYK